MNEAGIVGRLKDRAWFTGRGVSRFKTPERVIVLDRLPTMAAGKPDRTALRELALRAG